MIREHRVLPARAAAPASELDADAFQRRRLAAATQALSARRRVRDDAIADRLGFPTVEAWYAASRSSGATLRQKMTEAGMGEKWLRRLARRWRLLTDPSELLESPARGVPASPARSSR